MCASDHPVLTRACVTFILMMTVWPVPTVDAVTGLRGTAWSLIEINGADVPMLVGGKQPSLTLEAWQKKAVGYTGCNNFFATYTLEGESLSFGPIGATRRACPDPGAHLETSFLSTLERTRRWEIADGLLLLLDEDAVLARFSSGHEAAADPASLTYRLTSLPSGTVTLVNGEYRVPAAPGSASEIIVKLTDKQVFGKVSGQNTGAVVLVASSGGSGCFVELALLVRGHRGWENRDTVLLGDRVKVTAIRIENKRINVAMITHGPRDPLCCPTVTTVKTFLVRNARLVPAN
jgi:heat shock protein HslJ